MTVKDKIDAIFEGLPSEYDCVELAISSGIDCSIEDVEAFLLAYEVKLDKNAKHLIRLWLMWLLQIMPKTRNNIILILVVDLLVFILLTMVPFSLIVVGVLLVAEDVLVVVAGL